MDWKKGHRSFTKFGKLCKSSSLIITNKFFTYNFLFINPGETYLIMKIKKT
jgi:hypothetical protein